MAKIRVGISGWTFDGWRGNFYPKGLVQRRELEFASRKVSTIEINGTFYSLQKPESFQKWYNETPEDFCFSVKANQYVTHIRRLKEVDGATANFFASGILHLKEKLGPILWQFPPNVALKDDRFENFLKILPFDFQAAGELAKKHSEKLAGRTYTEVSQNFPIRHAFEFRHPSFMNPDFIELLRAYGVALVFAHSGLKSPYMEDVTADFIYARMHGQEDEFKKGYTKETLAWWADRVSCWTQGKEPADSYTVCSTPAEPKKRDAYIYFDTEAKEHAPSDAMSFVDRLHKVAG